MTPICISGCNGPWPDRVLAVIVGVSLLYMAYLGGRSARDWLRDRRDDESG